MPAKRMLVCDHGGRTTNGNGPRPSVQDKGAGAARGVTSGHQFFDGDVRYSTSSAMPVGRQNPS